MRILDNLLMRRRDHPRFSALPPHVRHRLTFACRELGDAEQAIAARLDLPQPPRLLMVDEEEAAIMIPSDRINMHHHDN